MVTRIELVGDRGMDAVGIAAVNADQLFLIRHIRRRIRDENAFAAQEKRRDALALGGHHLHAPVLARERRNRYPVVLIEERLGLTREIANDLGLLAGIDVGVL